jgi:cysteine-rich repeat protein
MHPHRARLCPFALVVLLGLTGGCPGAADDDDPVPTVPPGCGNGVLEQLEDCDDGLANSDEAPDACRSDCSLPACGDAVVDAGEACDDGALWGGDGCSPTCRVEPGALETEPNDDPDEAEPLEPGLAVTGALPEGDVDCFAFTVPSGGWLEADVEGAAEFNHPQHQDDESHGSDREFHRDAAVFVVATTVFAMECCEQGHVLTEVVPAWQR